MKQTIFLSFAHKLVIEAVVLLACSQMLVQTTHAALPVVGWGDNSLNQIAVSADATNAVAIAAGGGHNVAVKADGTVTVWGYNPYGQLNVPAGLNNVVAASAGYDHSLVLRNDGTVVGWGRNFEGQINVPAGLSQVVAVSANQHYSLALKSDGTIVAWGDNSYGQTSVPVGLANVVAISAGSFHALALKSDGTVVAWGQNNYGQINVPAGLSGVVAIAGGGEYSLAVKNDGTVVAWGANYYGQISVPADLGNVAAITAGWAHNLALKADGTVVAWGWNAYGQASVPAGLVNIGAVSAGYQHSLALIVDNQPPTNQPPTITCPQDAILQCASCDTDTNNTGVATATDDGPVTVSYSDSVSGDCPKVVTRTWTATDTGGKSATCVQTITCMQSSFVSMVTDSSGCTFDRDPSTPVQDFRLIFTQDPQNFPCYQVTASNPGQFLYNVFHTGAPGQQVTFNITLPYPFVTKGANPVHAYDWITVSGDGGQQCLQPGNAFFVGSQQVELSSYGNSPQASVIVTLTVPDSGVVFLAVHLDFGLKKLTGFTKNANDDAVDCDIATQMLIPNHGSYVFSVSGAQNGSASIANINVFKRNPGIAGMVSSVASGAPIQGAELKLTNAKGASVLSGITDEDGFYLMLYKHKGKAATYYLSVNTPFGYRETKRVTLKANSYLHVDFLTP